jgi:hypothetical protein
MARTSFTFSGLAPSGWSGTDARRFPIGNMTAEQVSDWTAAIGL